jgi:hypothetical protein
MKKLLVMLVLVASIGKARADEGMWLPMLLGQQVYDDMVKRGLKLTKEQLYSINKASIKDAIIIFGGGCTGEIVSNQGLIFTNHHCGYGAIAAASSVQNNYLRDGFYAFNKDQEIQSQLTVQFLEKIVDVTEEVEAGVKGLSWADRIKKIQEVYKSITDKVADNLKAKLALLGFEALVITVPSKNNEVEHKVRVGPLIDDTQILKIKNDLIKNNFKPILVKATLNNTNTNN